MKRFPNVTWLALALALGPGCGDDGGVATAPDTQELVLEDVPVAELAETAFLGDLSDEDRAAVREALRVAREELRAIRARLRAGEIARAQALEEARAVHDALLDALSQLLTEEQIDRLLRRGRDRPGPDLGLSDEQQAAVQALREEFRQFVRELRAAVESEEITAREARRRLREKARETRLEFCAILTPDQQAQVPFCRDG